MSRRSINITFTLPLLVQVSWLFILVLATTSSVVHGQSWTTQKATPQPSPAPTTSAPSPHPSLRPTQAPTITASPTKWTRPPVSQIAYPWYRFRLFTQLDLSTVNVVQNGLGYNETTWNTPGTHAAIEGKRFANLMVIDKSLVRSLGFNQLNYDCYMNHYKDYTWEELVDIGVAIYYEQLGYDVLTFHGNGELPATANKSWSQLSLQEQLAAHELCYVEGSWDVKSLTDYF